MHKRLQPTVTNPMTGVSRTAGAQESTKSDVEVLGLRIFLGEGGREMVFLAQAAALKAIRDKRLSNELHVIQLGINTEA